MNTPQPARVSLQLSRFHRRLLVTFDQWTSTRYTHKHFRIAFCPNVTKKATVKMYQRWYKDFAISNPVSQVPPEGGPGALVGGVRCARGPDREGFNELLRGFGIANFVLTRVGIVYNMKTRVS